MLQKIALKLKLRREIGGKSSRIRLRKGDSGEVQRRDTMDGRSVKTRSGRHRPGFALGALNGGCDFPWYGLYCSSKFCACKGLFGEDFSFLGGA